MAPPVPDPTLSALLARLTEAAPDRGVTDEAGLLRYPDLLRRVRDLAAGLARLGVVPGDRVALWMRNRREWVETWFAVAWAGATLIPLNTRFTEAEAAFVLRQSRSRWLVWAPDGALTGECLERLRARPGSALQGVVGLDGPQAPGDADLRDLAAGPGGPSQEREAQVGMIQYTSGSTAFPKGAMLGNAGLIRNAHGLGAAWRLTPADRILCANPLFHCGGSVFAFLAAATHAASVRLMGRWSVAEAVRLVGEEGLTVFPGIDAMVRDLVAAARSGARVAGGLRLVSTAASRQLFEAVTATLGADISNVYGLTECSPNVCVGDLRDSQERRLRAIGRPQPGLEVVIRDPVTREPVEPGEVGEIVVRGWAVMRGYFDDEPATRAAFDPDGFLRTGDLGSLDADGYLSFRGRLKQMIKSGGENVAIAEVEEALRSHPAVADVVVVPAPHPRYGEVGFAFVRCHDGQDVAPESLLGHSRARLAGFKAPRHVAILADLPRTGSGKIDRQGLEREAARRVEAGA